MSSQRRKKSKAQPSSSPDPRLSAGGRRCRDYCSSCVICPEHLYRTPKWVINHKQLSKRDFTMDKTNKWVKTASTKMHIIMKSSTLRWNDQINFIANLICRKRDSWPKHLFQQQQSWRCSIKAFHIPQNKKPVNIILELNAQTTDCIDFSFA